MKENSYVNRNLPIINFDHSLVHCEKLLKSSKLLYFPAIWKTKFMGMFNSHEYWRHVAEHGPLSHMEELKQFIDQTWPVIRQDKIFEPEKFLTMTVPLMPVIDQENRYLGVVELERIKKILPEIMAELEEHSQYQKNFQEKFLEIINCLDVSVFVTDSKGNVLMINEMAERNGGLEAKELIGRNMSELVQEGYCSDSVSLKVIEQSSPVTMFQKLGDSTELIVTGKPYFEKGRLKMVITTERDMTEVRQLEKQLDDYRKKTMQYESELEYLRTRNIVTEKIVMESKSMKEAVDLALRVAKLDTTILIQGESGTGKEVLADLIYRNSKRNKGPIIKVNCGAIPETLIESEFFGYAKGAFTGASREGKLGYFELAHKGTLFLDEIGELPLHLQSKFLRAIQEKEIMRVGGTERIEVDVRIIASTNIHLKESVKAGAFRLDLYYRLNVVPITIPPLRSRKKDIQALALRFVEIFNQKHGLQKTLNPKSLDILLQHDWPGNVRELENLLESAMVAFKEPEITPDQIIHQMNMLDIQEGKSLSIGIGSLKEEMARAEKNMLTALLSLYQTPAQIARALDVDKSTINRKIKKYGIQRE